MTINLDENAALLIVDVQQAIDQPFWSEHGPRNNPDAEKVMGSVLEHWREKARPIFHVRHDGQSEGGNYYIGGKTHGFKAEVTPLAGEQVIGKTVNSAFISTDLEARLKDQGIHQLVVMGVITNNSVEATVRNAGNLGFDTYLVEDACFTFAFPDYAGTLRSAQVVHDMSLANMDGEYCQVIKSTDIL
ncbi:cysteine hydrolase family protein [Kiloniella sp.]|uniref:cysteine hydrolase family protein n=1 Tax=Kiloniella sp. TaxID=1938587 RepID=UPI003B01E773